jgi:alpha-amylase/alpha-mannosidase (GH57 family)
MSKVSLALMWHQHQPYYPDDVAGENPMPWVRLHATKDYIGMLLHLEEVPEFHCVINLVPSLLKQIEGYAAGASDRHLEVSRKPADGLDRDDALYALDHFFMASPDTMIRPHPRYFELYQRRGMGIESAEQALGRFRERDLRDLQVWGNLTWFHPLLFEKDPELAEFKARERHYSEADKTRLLEIQHEIVKQIIPMHRELAERGQIELTTTPYYHPIIPLLLDKRSSKEAMPGVELPRSSRSNYPEDAETHVARAVASHRERFGSSPKGMWPSEGSVCQDIIPLLARHGIEWIATDEEILGCSTQGKIGRDGRGHVRHPELLYRPWKAKEGNDELAIVFRDHALSDQIGFHYQRSPGQAAANDFIGKLHAIGDGCRQHSTLVPVILDGENCWEYYPDGGVSFLRSLYQSAVRDHKIKPVKIGDYLREHPPIDTVPRLFAGSWISHNFAIWIGHDEDNRAWDALDQTRRFLVDETKSGRRDQKAIDRAWEELYIAEGSDWFWWYGDDHSSALDALFDHLFRKHLRNVYVLLDQEPPGSLFAPISRASQARPAHDDPNSLLRVKVDGETSYFEWINAAKYVCGAEKGGAMTQVTKGLVAAVRFGFSVDKLYIRLDFAGAARDRLSECDRARVAFVDPADCEIRIDRPATRRPGVSFHRLGREVECDDLEAATGKILELAIPFARLKTKPGETVRFYVELFKGETGVDRAPREGILEISVPTPDFERIMWQV